MRRRARRLRVLEIRSRQSTGKRANPSRPILRTKCAPPRHAFPRKRTSATQYTCQDVARDSHLFEALGVGLGSAETLAVSLMARRLGEDPALGVQHVRFFGKFFGLQRDYYVFETKLKDGAAAEEGESGEDVPAELGAGANAHVYFTCSAPGDAFERLPEARPEHIRTARALRRFLTGRLEADVSSFPLFPGKEAEYLRAQVKPTATSVWSGRMKSVRPRACRSLESRAPRCSARRGTSR